MANLKNTGSKGASLLSVAVIVLCAMTAAAQSATDRCRPAPVIPLASEPPAKIVIDPPLPGPVAARGVVVTQYCAENLHLVPVFGPNALAVSPRVGHIHVRLDDASWVWADASGNPIILMGLSPSPHKVFIELEDANHNPLDKGTVTFVIPEKFAAPKPGQTDGEAAPIFITKIPPGYRDWKLVSVAQCANTLTPKWSTKLAVFDVYIGINATQWSKACASSRYRLRQTKKNETNGLEQGL